MTTEMTKKSAGAASPPGRLEMEFPASAERLSEVRRALEQLADGTRLSRMERDDLLTAVDEAVANAIRHGSPRGKESVVHVGFTATPAGIAVSVQDEGQGFTVPSAAPTMPGPEANGGRGLPLMCALSDRVEIASNNGGTRVSLEKKARGG